MESGEDFKDSIAEISAKSRLISQFHFDASKEAMRVTFLANGAALLALLTYLGKSISTPLLFAVKVPLAAAISAFGVGLMLSVIAFIQMWRHQQEVDHGSVEWKMPNKNIRRILYVSVLFFAVGLTCASWFVVAGSTD